MAGKIIAGNHKPKILKLHFHLWKWAVDLIWRPGFLIERNPCSHHPGLYLGVGSSFEIIIKKADVPASNHTESECLN